MRKSKLFVFLFTSAFFLIFPTPAFACFDCSASSTIIDFTQIATNVLFGMTVFSFILGVGILFFFSKRLKKKVDWKLEAKILFLNISFTGLFFLTSFLWNYIYILESSETIAEILTRIFTVMFTAFIFCGIILFLISTRKIKKHLFQRISFIKQALFLVLSASLIFYLYRLTPCTPGYFLF